MKTRSKILIAVLVILAIFLVAINVMESTHYASVEKQTIHPCQKLMEDIIMHDVELGNLYKYGENIEELEEYANTYEEKNEEMKQLTIKHDCDNIRSEWATPEFMVKMEFLIENKFLP